MQHHTRIIATIGPASAKPEVLGAMVAVGMDIARLNFSWGTHLEQASYIETVRTVARAGGKTVRILQDLSGPRIQRGSEHGFHEASETVFTEKDKTDLLFAKEQGIELVALSFVGRATDIEDLRAFMRIHDYHVPIIAKIERRVALLHIDEIVAAADAVMVARGDLGNELPLEQIPHAQRTIIDAATRMQKPAIVATQMLLSMTHATVPTRAEVTDVYTAVLEGAGAVMLSEETASGEHPTKAVYEMRQIVTEAEKELKGVGRYLL